MLTTEQNELLCSTNPGTPMGALFRRFWLPVLLPSELPEPDCPPIRVRILGEDLVAFRDTDGSVGFFTQACPHRGASLFFGRNKERGLRCVYHGWKFDVTGACVDMPSEPPESNFKSRVSVRSYSSAEFGGLVWIYMGPKETQPPVPQYDWTLQDYPNLKVYKWMQDCNYTQAIESYIDTVHVNFLHRTFGGPARPRRFDRDAAPVLQIKETDFGFVYGGRRPAGDQYYWRITPLVLPSFVSIPNQGWDGNANFVVPVDDEHSWWFTVSPPGIRPAAGAPEREHVVLTPGTWRQTHNRDNDYFIDREIQRTYNYTGLPGNRVQDAMVTESMGAIPDRAKEHLGTTDRAIIFWRRQLMRLASELESGIEPKILSEASLFRVRPIDVITKETNLLPLWEADHAEHLKQAVLPVPIVS